MSVDLVSISEQISKPASDFCWHLITRGVAYPESRYYSHELFSLTRALGLQLGVDPSYIECAVIYRNLGRTSFVRPGDAWLNDDFTSYED